MKVALINPPLSGHHHRGTGIYTTKLYECLKKNDNVRVDLVNISDNLHSFDLVHYPYFDPFFLTLPLAKSKPAVVTVHDLIPFRFPRKFPRGIKGEIKWQIQKISLSSVWAIITDSESSKKDIVKYAHYPSDRIHVVCLGVGEEFKPDKSEAGLEQMRKKLDLPEKYLLYVGDINYNKNIEGLLMAFKGVLKAIPDLHLILVGRGFVNPSQRLITVNDLIRSLGLTGKVKKYSNLKTKELVSIYNLAEVYLQPSFAEGFGLPVLEAMACGVPVVVADNTSLKEVAGRAVVLIDPYSTESIVKGLKTLLGDNNKRKRFIRAGLERAKMFSWKKCAEETVEVYQRVLSS